MRSTVVLPDLVAWREGLAGSGAGDGACELGAHLACADGRWDSEMPDGLVGGRFGGETRKGG